MLVVAEVVLSLRVSLPLSGGFMQHGRRVDLAKGNLAMDQAFRPGQTKAVYIFYSLTRSRNIRCRARRASMTKEGGCWRHAARQSGVVRLEL